MFVNKITFWTFSSDSFYSDLKDTLTMSKHSSGNCDWFLFALSWFYSQACFSTHRQPYLPSFAYIYLYRHSKESFLPPNSKESFSYTYMHAYLHIVSYIHTDIHTYIHAYHNTCMHTYLHTYILTDLPSYVHECVHTYLHTYIPVNIRT